MDSTEALAFQVVDCVFDRDPRTFQVVVRTVGICEPTFQIVDLTSASKPLTFQVVAREITAVAVNAFQVVVRADTRLP